MKILVTGATGFVGRAIVAALLEENFKVYSLGGVKSENTHDLPNFRKADIADFESLKVLEELENIDAIIHSAGLAHQFKEVKKEDFWKVNVDGTKNIAQIGVQLKAKRFILISSVSVYGKSKNAGGKRPFEESEICEPEGFYAQSKLEAENAAGEICEKNQIPLTILRLATVIGENDRGNTGRLIKAIDKRRFIWIGKGENYKSLIYKRDVARACVTVLQSAAAETEIFNVTAEPVLMKEIVSEIESGLDKKILPISVPPFVLDKIFKVNSKLFRIKRLSNLSETVSKWLSDDVFSGEKIAARYGFRAETPVLEAVRRQVEAYKNQE